MSWKGWHAGGLPWSDTGAMVCQLARTADALVPPWRKLAGAYTKQMALLALKRELLRRCPSCSSFSSFASPCWPSGPTATPSERGAGGVYQRACLRSVAQRSAERHGGGRRRASTRPLHHESPIGGFSPPQLRPGCTSDTSCATSACLQERSARAAADPQAVHRAVLGHGLPVHQEHIPLRGVCAGEPPAPRCAVAALAAAGGGLPWRACVSGTSGTSRKAGSGAVQFACLPARSSFVQRSQAPSCFPCCRRPCSPGRPPKTRTCCPSSRQAGVCIANCCASLQALPCRAHCRAHSGDTCLMGRPRLGVAPPARRSRCVTLCNASRKPWPPSP